jgi:hypothetical protein
LKEQTEAMHRPKLIDKSEPEIRLTRDQLREQIARLTGQFLAQAWLSKQQICRDYSGTDDS